MINVNFNVECCRNFNFTSNIYVYGEAFSSFCIKTDWINGCCSFDRTNHGSSVWFGLWLGEKLFVPTITTIIE